MFVYISEYVSVYLYTHTFPLPHVCLNIPSFRFEFLINVPFFSFKSFTKKMRCKRAIIAIYFIYFRSY